MANNLGKGKWQCGYCDKIYVNMVEAEACRTSHELIYVPFTKTELGRLVQYLFIPEEGLLTEALVNKLRKYSTKIVAKPNHDSKIQNDV